MARMGLCSPGHKQLTLVAECVSPGDRAKIVLDTHSTTFLFDLSAKIDHNQLSQKEQTCAVFLSWDLSHM